MLNQLLNRIYLPITRFKLTTRYTLTSAVQNISYLPSYYRINDLMWQDGLLIDFLQKKVADKWIRRFLVCSSYLFSERVVFKFVVRFYIDYVVWPAVHFSIFEYSNVAFLLTATLTSLTLLILAFHLNYLYVVLFI
jgi:hypothetical protein